MSGEEVEATFNLSDTGGTDGQSPNINEKEDDVTGQSKASENPLYVLESAVFDTNCSDLLELATANGTCGSYTVTANVTNTTTVAEDRYYFYEVSARCLLC